MNFLQIAKADHKNIRSNTVSGRSLSLETQVFSKNDKILTKMEVI